MRGWLKSQAGLVCPWCHEILRNPKYRSLGKMDEAEAAERLPGAPINRTCVTCGNACHVWLVGEGVVVQGYHPLGGEGYWRGHKNELLGSRNPANAARKNDDWLTMRKVATLLEVGYNLDEIARTLRITTRRAGRLARKAKDNG